MSKHLTLAQRHQLRVRAAAEAAAQADSHGDMQGATTYELQLAQLKQDQLHLSNFQSLETRAQLKLEKLESYQAYIDGVLQADTGVQDEVLTTLMVWHFDCQNFTGGLRIAEYALKHNLAMPDRFARTTATLVAEEVANAALTALKADEPFTLEVLAKANDLTAEQDMPDEVRAKLYFARGLALLPAEDSPLADLQQAADYLAEAIRLHDRVGAKKDLERIERWIKKHAESEAKAQAKPEPEKAQDKAEAGQADS